MKRDALGERGLTVVTGNLGFVDIVEEIQLGFLVVDDEMPAFSRCEHRDGGGGCGPFGYANGRAVGRGGCRANGLRVGVAFRGTGILMDDACWLR